MTPFICFCSHSGGSDFNPSNKSEAEMQRFCQSYMTELAKYIGPDIDIPWMGMGVGEHEMGYLFGQYKRIKSTHSYSSGSTFMTGSKQDCRVSRNLKSSSPQTILPTHLRCTFKSLSSRLLVLALSILPMKCSRTRATRWKASAV